MEKSEKPLVSRLLTLRFPHIRTIQSDVQHRLESRQASLASVGCSRIPAPVGLTQGLRRAASLCTCRSSPANLMTDESHIYLSVRLHSVSIICARFYSWHFGVTAAYNIWGSVWGPFRTN